jgi:hypothetical protein
VEGSLIYGLAANYVPGDLVRLGDSIPGRIELPEMLLRRVAAIPLEKMITQMLDEGFNPTIASSYRSSMISL